ncbi:DinB family protein [Tabrizicola sp. BL-A-41-H6]|uniref:DinB family protein n=1 Tax=Tabrizicola sp. BL-A-41-H6 TaxID=3421107 RepID=UPI003D67AB14
MTDPHRPYRQLARNNRLANRRLAGAIAALQPGEWEAPRTSFFPSLRATMNHIYLVDRFYIDALQGGTLGVSVFASPEPFPDPAPLAAAQDALDTTVLALITDAPDLNRPVHIHRADRIQTETLADTLMHLFLHSQHHRGQVHAMLSGSTVKPPQLDEFFMADDARFRADDLAALGWTESDLA